MADLKPCPFCGGEARINSDHEAVRDTEGHLWAFTVGCSKCCATSGLCCSPDKAIEAWNTRQPMEAVVAEMEKLQRHTWGVTMLTAEDYVKVSDLRKVIEIARKEGEEHDDKLQESQ